MSAERARRSRTRSRSACRGQREHADDGEEREQRRIDEAACSEKPASITRFSPARAPARKPARPPALARDRHAAAYGQRSASPRELADIALADARDVVYEARQTIFLTQALFQRHDPCLTATGTGREMYLAADIGGEDLFGLAEARAESLFRFSCAAARAAGFEYVPAEPGSTGANLERASARIARASTRSVTL